MMNNMMNIIFYLILHCHLTSAFIYSHQFDIFEFKIKNEFIPNGSKVIQLKVFGLMRYTRVHGGKLYNGNRYHEIKMVHALSYNRFCSKIKEKTSSLYNQ